MRVIAVVPAYNESQVIGAVIQGLRPFVDTVVVVDDGSNDGTAEAAASQGATVLRHFLNRGQGAALQTGLRYAIDRDADAVVTTDADGQHRAGDIPRLLEPLLLNRFDVVLGSRFLAKESIQAIPGLRRILLHIAVVFEHWRTGLNITDTHNGFRAFSRRAGSLIRIRQDGMAHASEILDEIVRLQLRYTEVSVQVNYSAYARRKGQSGFLGSLRILRDLFYSRISH